MRWLTECSPEAVAAAVRVVAPELDGQAVVIRGRVDSDDPMWWSSSAAVGADHIVKFAWSAAAARRVAHEIRVLTGLARCGVPFLPEVPAASEDPVLLVTRRAPGRTLFESAGGIDRDSAGEQLARFVAALHRPEVRARLAALVDGLARAERGVQHPAATSVLRKRLGQWVGAEQRRAIARRCDWADAVLDRPGREVVAHGDLHGDNQLWSHGELRAVVDFETVCLAEPEYDLRALPEIGPGVELLTAVVGHYERFADRRLSVDRIMAWHTRTVLWDVLWRCEAGAPMPGGGNPEDRVDELGARLRAAGIEP
jgi:aminoglycoside phosphotransferase (APT) family kinase protein